MANQDYPGVCMACTTDECEVVAPDVAAVRERVLYEPITGYTKNIINNLTTAMPDIFKNVEDAYMAFDAVKAVIAMGLKNRDNVVLHGLGKFRVDKQDEKNVVTFEPDQALNAIVGE